MPDMGQEVSELVVALQELLGASPEEVEAALEAVDPAVLEGVDRDTYQEAMETVFDQYEVPAEMREPVYEHLDAEGDYSPEGLRQNIAAVLDNDDLTSHIDNSITVEGAAADPYAEEPHYGDDDGGVRNIHQANEVNEANATAEGAIAGRDQWGQFQTGDGQQVGDNSYGPNVQGDTSGQVAGGNATADDITTGDGNFNNDGHINDSAIAFGDGAEATNQADDVYDASVNNSYNEDNVGNIDNSYNDDNVGNTDVSSTHTVDENLHADVDVTESFNRDDDGHDIDDSYNIHDDAADAIHE